MDNIRMADSHVNNLTTSNRDLNLLDWAKALINRKKLVLGVPILFALCAAVFGFSLPNIYRASTKILPRQDSLSNTAAVLSQLSGIAGSTAGSFSIQIPIDSSTRIPLELYVSMLKSRSVADKLIQRFEPTAVTNGKMESARSRFARNTTIKSTPDGLILIEYEDVDAKRAAEIANAYVSELLMLVKTLGLSDASQRRQFFERQLHSASEKQAEAEKRLRQLDGRAVEEIDNRELAVLDKIAMLRAEISVKELQSAAREGFVVDDSREIVRYELGKMRAELAKLDKNRFLIEGGNARSEREENTKNAKFLHDARYYKYLHKLLEAQYEIAQFDEARGPSPIRVLDAAIMPQMKVKPERSVIVLSSAFVGLFIVAFWVLLVDVIRVEQHRRRTTH